MPTHQRSFDQGLTELKGKLLRMGELGESMVERAVAMLVMREEARAADVPALEDELNRLQLAVDQQAVTLLATRQPVANDLRFIVMATRVNSELERIGDLAVNITENARVLVQQPPIKPLVDIPRMARSVGQMARDSLTAFIDAKAELARSVVMTDDEVDLLKDQIFRELLTYMMADPRTIERAIALILVSRHLERIADHATNIAQEAIYMIEGRDVRHPRMSGRKPGN